MTKEERIDHLKRCMDNTAKPENYEDLGLLYFAREFLPACREFRQGLIHYKMEKNFLELFNKKKTRRTQRQMYIEVFREGAKSTYFSHVNPLYLANMFGMKMYVRYEAEGWEGSDRHDYDIQEIEITKENIVLMSETHASAERFVNNARIELTTNSYLRAVFGDKSPRSEKDQMGQWRRDLFTTRDGTTFGGIGAGQQVRGFLLSGQRITLGIFDDIYSRKNTLTEDTREKLRYWFYAEAINSTDSVKGKVVLVGTIMHEDTVFTDVKQTDTWKGFSYPVISENELLQALKLYDFNPETREVIRPANEELITLEQSFTSLAWPERQGLPYIMDMYIEAYKINKLSYFYQEKLNILSAPDDELFNEAKVVFTNVQYTKDYGVGWVEFDWNSYRWKGVVSLTIGVDIASSERLKADDTAIIVGGWAHVFPQLTGMDYKASLETHPYKEKGLTVPIVLDTFMGKMDIFHDPTRAKPGMVNKIADFVKKYTIERIVMEANAQQGLVVREARKYFSENLKHSPSVIAEISVMRKEEAIASVMQPVFNTSQAVIFHDLNHHYTVWSQLKHLGAAAHDDGADALKNVYKYARKPSKKPDYQELAEGFSELSQEFTVPDWRTV